MSTNKTLFTDIARGLCGVVQTRQKLYEMGIVFESARVNRQGLPVCHLQILVHLTRRLFVQAFRVRILWDIRVFQQVLHLLRQK